MTPRLITPEFIGPRFPNFYAECAYYDGARDARAGHSDSRHSYMRWGDPEPLGMAWYNRGRLASGGPRCETHGCANLVAEHGDFCHGCEDHNSQVWLWGSAI